MLKTQTNMNDSLKEILASNTELEKPLSELCVLSESEEIHKGLIKSTFHFSDILKNIDYVGSCIKSSYFSVGSPNYCSFRFLLYPNGKNEASKGFVCLTIEFYSKLPESAWVEGSVSFLGYDSKKFSTGGCVSCIEIDDFEENQVLRKLIGCSDDEPVIQCSIKIKSREVKCNFDGNTVEYAESRKFSPHKESLFKRQSFSDVTFHLEGGEVKAHKAILAEVPFFQELFNNCEGHQDIELTHIKLKTFEHIVQFLYTKDIPIFNFQLASELYIIADEFQMFDLKNICSSYFGANLTEENVFIVISLADHYNDKSLKRYGINFIKSADTEKLVLKSIVLYSEWLYFQHY